MIRFAKFVAGIVAVGLFANPTSFTKNPNAPVRGGRVIDDRSYPGGGAPIAAGNMAAGVGLGATGTVAVAAGGSTTRGTITTTANGAGLAQATATVDFTFPNAFDVAPVVFVRRTGGTAAATVQVRVVSVSTTVVQFQLSVLPVAAETVIFEFVVLDA